MDPYPDSLDHLRHELSRIDLLLRRAVIVTRARHAGVEQDEFRGLVISESEIDSMAQVLDLVGEPWRAAQAVEQDLRPIDEHIDQLRIEIDGRIAATRAEGRVPRLASLASSFELSQAEIDLLLLALGPELEPRYETLYAFLQNDVTRKRPSVDLGLNVICRDMREKIFARVFFAEDAPLVRYALVDVLDEAHDKQPTFLRRFVKARESVVRMLLDQPAAAPETGTWLRASDDAAENVSESTRAQIRNLAAALVSSDAQPSVIFLCGTQDEALTSAARLAAHELGHPLLRVELAQLESGLASIARDARLYSAALLVVAGDQGRASSHLRELASLLRTPVFVAGPASAAGVLPQSMWPWRIDVRPSDYPTRLETWRGVLGDAGIAGDAARLADMFRFAGDRVRQTAALARSMAALRDPTDPQPTMTDVLSAGRALTAPDLARLAITIEPRYGWEDLVLPDEKLRQLESIAARIVHRRTVHRDWGFGRKLARGKGVSVLFSGPSGTGKTMAAEVLARALGVDLYQVDLSAVVSKYIGETEKNLERIFTEGELSNQLILFDEADAIFGRRTEVKDAHDRYANIEVDYLLQRMEKYAGPIVLATNFQKNLDEAFVRRLDDILEFPFPDPSARERIWRGHFPDEAPRGEIDFEFLAEQFDVSGGNIRNVVLNSAFAAAQEGGPISMRHVIASLRGEYQKQGKLVMAGDLGRYAETES